MGRAPDKIPAAWATSFPAASSRSMEADGAQQGGGRVGHPRQTVSSHAEHSTSLHSGAQSEMYGWV